MNGHGEDHRNFNYDPGYPQTYDTNYEHDYDRVTARDIADLLHHSAEMRCNLRDGVIDPAERVAFLTRKAELFNRIARDAEQIRVDDYSWQVRQMATDARAAAAQAQPPLPPQRVGPNQSATPTPAPSPGGARSEKNSGATSA